MAEVQACTPGRVGAGRGEKRASADIVFTTLPAAPAVEALQLATEGEAAGLSRGKPVADMNSSSLPANHDAASGNTGKT